MEAKTKEQPIAEIELLCKEVAKLEQEKAERKWAERLLQALNKAARSMEQALTPEEIFSAVNGQLKELGFSSAVFLTDESQKRLFLKYWSYETAAIRTAEKLAGRKHEDFPLLIEAVDVYRKTIWERETVFVENVKDVIEQLFQAVLPGPAKKLTGPIAKILKVSKDINAPLIVGNKVVGMLSVQSEDLTADDIPAITAFAHQMAAAWYKATLLQDLQRSLAERKRAEEALQKAHNEVERRVEERTAELLKSNEQLTQEITGRKWAEEALRASEQNFRSSLDNSPLGVRIVSAEGETLYVNQATLDIYGYSSLEELEAVPRSKRYTPESYAEHQERKEKRKLGKFVPPHYEISTVRKDGEVRQLEVFRREVMWGEKTQFQVIYHDITEQKKARSKLEELEALEFSILSAVPHAVIGLHERRIVFANKGVEAVFGWKPEELIGKTTRVLYRSEEEYEEIASHFYPVLERQRTYSLEFPCRHKDGRDIVCMVSDSRIGERLVEKKVVVTYEDITERKKAEEKLRASEELHKAVVGNVADAIAISVGTKRVFVNKAFLALHGLRDTSQVLGVSQDQFILPEDRQMVNERSLARERGYPVPSVYEYRICRPNGEVRTVQTSAVAITYEGQPATLAVLRDITERNKAEEQLRRSEEKYRTTFENTGTAMAIIEEDTTISLVNHQFEILAGYPKEEIEGKRSWTEFVHREDLERMKEYHRKRRESRGKAPTQYEFHFVDREGNIKNIFLTVEVIPGTKKSITSLMDITERKQAGDEIKRRAAQAVLGYEVGQRVSSKLELDELLSEIVTAVRDALDYYGVMILLVDEEAQRLTMQSIAGGYVDIFPKKLYHAIGEGMTGYAAASGKTQSSGDVSKDPHYVREADEETKSELAVPIKRGQKVIGVLDIQSDEFDAFDETDVMLMETLADQIAVAIENARLYEAVQQELAERKKAEEALGESERHFRALIENSSDIIQIVDSEGIIRYLSPSVQRILGYKPEELIGRPSIDLVHPDDLPLVAKGFEEALQKPCVPVITVCRCKHKDGTWRVIEGTGINQLDNPSVNGFIANMHDITERRRAVEELEGAKKRFQTLFNIMVDPVVIVDGKGKFLEITDRLEEITGFKKAELLGRNFMRTNIVTAKSKAILMKNLAKRMMGMRVAPYEVEVLRKDGRRLPYEVNAAKIEYEGKGADMVSFRDISARKKAEEALRESEEFSSSLLDSSPNPILVVNPDTSIRYVNPALEKLTGFTSSELIGVKIPHPWWAEETWPQVQGDFEERMRKGAHRLEDVFKKKNGERFWVEITTRAIMRNGELQYHLSNWVDITERKKAQEQLERSFIDLAETVSRAMSSRDPYTASHQRRVAELARLVGEKMGLDKDRLRGLYIGGLLHDIGKISTPESILSKPGQLVEEEWALIHAHAMRGYEILDGSRFPWPVAEMALHHHERLDGSGYPHGISGDKLSLENRILGVCDVVEAMSSFRPYRPARSKEEVLEEIKSGRGTKYDANVVDVMLEIIEGEEFEFVWQPETQAATKTTAL